MEPKEVLIRILSKFDDAGAKAAEASIKQLKQAASTIASEGGNKNAVNLAMKQAKIATALEKAWQKQAQAATQAAKADTQAAQSIERVSVSSNKATLALSNLGNKLKTSLSGLGSRTLGDLTSGFTRATRAGNLFSNSLKRVGSNFRSLTGGILSAINPLRIFQTGFGRVTMGLATWEVWRNVKYGFEAMADAAVTANAKMQTAMGAFTAFSGGSTQSAQTFIDILKQMSIETGVAFDALLDGAKALPTKIGQNFKAFEDIVKTAIALGFLDPAQGVEGAFFALRNALEGGAQGLRSLVQRFEIGTVSEFNDALAETGDVLSALQLMLKRTGLDVENFIGSQKNTFPVVLNAIKSILRELIRISTSNVFQVITNNLVKVRDFLQENQMKLEAVAQVISEKLVVAYQMLVGFIKEVILSGKQLTAGGVFDAIIDGINWVIGKIEMMARAIISIFELVANIVNSVFGWFSGEVASGTTMSFGIKDAGDEAIKAVDDTTNRLKDSGKSLGETVNKVTETIAEIVTKPIQAVGGIIDALTSVTEGGKETIKRFVEGMVAGLSPESLAKVREAVLDNVINLEGQVIAQEKSIKLIEDWVDEAAKEVQRARDKLQIFDLQTADIPERYTRARRRQLETEIMAAEQEERRRKEALDAAKEQLAVTKDILAAQRNILSNIESAAKEAAKQSGSGINMGFVAPSKDLEEYKKKVEELTDSFRDRLQPTFTRLREDFEKLSELFRGLFGAETTGKFNEFYEIGVGLADAVGRIGDGIGSIINSIDSIFASLIPGWENLDPGLRKVLAAAVGYVGIKALVIPLSFEITKWILGATVGKAATALWGALAAGASGIPLGGAAGTAASIFIPLGIFIAAIKWGENEKELMEWITFKRQKELLLSIQIIGTEALNKLLALFGYGEESFKTVTINGETFTPGVDGAGVLDDTENIFESMWNKLTTMWNEGDMRKAAEYGFTPIVDEAEKVNDELVGHSIFPDMMDAIYDLFGNLPNRLTGPLGTLSATISQSMSGIKMQWMADWQEMVDAAVNSMNQINATQSQLQTATAASTASSGNQQTRNSVSAYEQLRISLNAQETRRLMQEGVADGMADVARGLRGTSGYSGR